VETGISVQTFRQLPSPSQAELRKLWTHGVAVDTHAVGWLPTAAFDTRAENDDVIAVYRNEDLVGWAMIARSNHRGVMKLYQIWVRPDARIIEHGRALVDAITKRALQRRCLRIEAWVAEDLPANFFWSAIGFLRSNWRWGRGRNPRKIFRWITPTLHLSIGTNLGGKHAL
jgi:GNAT superfamily N-acetyltransferase